MKTHTKRVMGMAYEKTSKWLYSIGEDGRFKVTDMQSREVLYNQGPGKSAFKYMIYDKTRAVFILADGDGFIYIYSSISVLH